jgi:hypothetical protein
MGLQLGQHVSLHLCSFLWQATRNHFGAHMPFFSSLLEVPLESRQRDAKELDNLSPGTALVYGSQHSLAQIL